MTTSNLLLAQHGIGAFAERSALEDAIRSAHQKSQDNQNANFNVCQCNQNRLDFFAYSDQAYEKTKGVGLVTLVYTTSKGYVMPEDATLEVIGKYEIPSKEVSSLNRLRKPQIESDDSQTSQVLLSSYA